MLASLPVPELSFENLIRLAEFVQDFLSACFLTQNPLQHLI
jgi:hypothetical protein